MAQEFRLQIIVVDEHAYNVSLQSVTSKLLLFVYQGCLISYVICRAVHVNYEFVTLG